MDIALIMTDHYLVGRDLRKIGRIIKNEKKLDLFYFFLPRRRKFYWNILKVFGLEGRFRKGFENVDIHRRDQIKVVSREW